MSKLTLPILCAFLPHKVQVQGRYNNQITLRYRHFTNDYGDFIGIDKEAKLFLRPLSSLTKEITHNGETFVPVDYLLRDISPSYSQECFNQDKAWVLNDGYRAIGEFPHKKVQKLIEWHFDVFGGIEAGWVLPIEEDGK